MSFEVKSLFTSIPIDFAMQAGANALECDDSLLQRSATEAEDLRKLFKFCLENTYFVFISAF